MRRLVLFNLVLIAALLAEHGAFLWLWMAHPERIGAFVRAHAPAAALHPSDDPAFGRSAAPSDLGGADDALRQMRARMRRMLTEMAGTDAAAPRAVGGLTATTRPAAAWPIVHDPLTLLQEDIDRLFEMAHHDFDWLHHPARFEEGWDRVAATAAVNIEDQDTHYQVRVALPEADKSSIRIVLHGQILTLSSGGGTASATARFETRLMLPGPVDGARAQATHENGVLRIRVPKPEDRELLVRLIEVM